LRSHVGTRRATGNRRWNADRLVDLDRCDYGVESSISAFGLAAIMSAILIAIAVRRREIVPFMPKRTLAK
jgi:hypothetical protein